jgi:hypothetical protein
MTPEEIVMWNQKEDQRSFIEWAKKSFNKLSEDIAAGNADFKDLVNKKQQTLESELKSNVQNWYNMKAMDDANWKKVQDQVDESVKAQKEKLDMMEKEFIKWQLEAKKTWEAYNNAQIKQADIETAGESAWVAGNLSKAGLSGAAISNAAAWVADKNHKRYVELAKVNFETTQDLTKKYTDFYDKLIATMGTIDATQRGVMDTIAQNVSARIKNLEDMNKKYVTDMNDPLHKYIDAQTAQHTEQAGKDAGIDATMNSWNQSSFDERKESITNNLIRLGGSDPTIAVQLKNIPIEDMDEAVKQPTLIDALMYLSKSKNPASAAVGNAALKNYNKPTNKPEDKNKKNSDENTDSTTNTDSSSNTWQTNALDLSGITGNTWNYWWLDVSWLGNVAPMTPAPYEWYKQPANSW